MGTLTTPLYIAPEVLKDPKIKPTIKVDIWAAGIILYEFLTNENPFEYELL
jgi:eukaryotic-like serine/threonine-protein kinase